MLGMGLCRGKGLDDRVGVAVVDGEEEGGVLAAAAMIHHLRILGPEVNPETLSNRVGDRGSGVDWPVVRQLGIWPGIGATTGSRTMGMDMGGTTGSAAVDCLVEMETMVMAAPGVPHLGGLGPLGLVPAPVLVMRVLALVLPAGDEVRFRVIAK